MAKPKTGMTPEVTRIFEDLDAYRDYCRMHYCKFDEADMYRRGTNWERMQKWNSNFNKKNSREAIYSFAGDTYSGFDALTLNNKDIKFFENIGANIGLLFQITDDLIDFKGSSKIAGKITGKDKKKGKATLISLLGYQNAIKYSDKIKFKIIKDLNKLSSNSSNLNETLDYILTRNK